MFNSISHSYKNKELRRVNKSKRPVNDLYSNYKQKKDKQWKRWNNFRNKMNS